MFNKERFLDNAFSLAKAKGIKINDVESAIGVSAGYLSKLRYDESRKNINADMMFAIAEYFSVSVDYLNNAECGGLNNDEITMVALFEKFKMDTNNGVCKWEREPEAMMKDQRGHIANALIRKNAGQLMFDSKFDIADNVDFAGDSYVLEIKYKTYLAMIKLRDLETHKEFIETYLFFESDKGTKISKLCAYNEKEPSELDAVILDLYQTAENSGKRLSLEYDTSKFLKDYLEESDEYHYKNLPF